MELASSNTVENIVVVALYQALRLSTIYIVILHRPFGLRNPNDFCILWLFQYFERKYESYSRNVACTLN